MSNLHDTGPQPFPKRPQFCKFDVNTGSISIISLIFLHHITYDTASPHSEFTKFRPLWNMQFESKVLEDYNPYQNQHNGDLQGYHNIIIIASNAPVWTRVN